LPSGFLNFPIVSATAPLNDLHATLALPEDVCNAQLLPDNFTDNYLNTTNPYANGVSPLNGYYEPEGNRPLYVLIFGDEEERSITRLFHVPYTWDMWARLQIERGDEALVSIFGIDIRILGWEEWDSDDSKTSMYDLWDELVAETSSYLGQWYEGPWWQKYVDAVIGITAQQTPYDNPKIAGLTSGPIEIDKGEIFILLKWQKICWALREAFLS
jgi:hypothetical protein